MGSSFSVLKRDLKIEMQQPGGLLPARAGPSRTFIFTIGENADKSLLLYLPIHLDGDFFFVK